MKFSSLGFGATVATALVAGSTFATSPAEAALLSGDFDVNLNGTVKNISLTKLDFKSTFNDSFTSGQVTGTGDFAGYSLFKIKDLDLTQFPTTGISSFITFQSTNPALAEITLDLLKVDNVAISPGKKFSADIGGLLKRAGNDATPFDVELSFIIAKLSKGESTGSANATAVPTPALLPGLIGLGVAALRRKNEESTEENA
ncbi:MAG: hypothetical protein DCF32_12730 [Leptolyngbya sp.]|nr:MAG: hypothetical protein DCF32_12730 [Leptolyngbya sp.]